MQIIVFVVKFKLLVFIFEQQLVVLEFLLVVQLQQLVVLEFQFVFVKLVSEQ